MDTTADASTMPEYCQNCGAQLAQDDAFCGECGEPVSGQDAPDDQGEPAGGHDPPSSGGAGAGQGEPGTQGQPQEPHSQGQQRQGGHGRGQTGRGQGRQQRGDQYGGGQPRTGRGGQGPTPADLPQPPRKNAIDTFKQAVSWVIDVPILFAAFLAVGLIDFIGQQILPLLGLVSLVLTVLVWGAAYHYTVRFLSGTRIDGSVDEISDIISTVTDRLISLIVIAILYFIAVGIGLILLILPGIYIGGRLILAFPACVLDGKGATDSLSYGWEVGQGNVLKLVGIFLINLLAVIGIGAVLGILGIASTGGVTSATPPVVALLTAPISAFLGAAVQMAVARVYLENRFAPGQQNAPPQQSPAREPARGNQTD